jgi:CubicO group peptidase (beta-lactamase class C family)
MTRLAIFCVVVGLVTQVSAATPIPRFVFVDGSERFSDLIGCDGWNDRPGFALAVVRDGELLLQQSCGLADVKRGRPIEADTRFRATAIGRTVTAVAVLLLYQEGRIGLDDTLADHIPELPAWAERVRVMHVLQHTAGLPDYPRGRTEEIVSFLNRQPALEFEPGTDFAERETGYALLVELVRRVSGSGFSAFVDQKMLRPLGMEDSAWIDDPGPELPNLAVGYGDDDSRGDRGGLFTTVLDLSRWYEALASDRLLRESTTEIMLHRPLTPAGGLSRWAMGWTDRTRRDDTRYSGLRGYGVSGEDGAFASYLAFYPDEHLCVILLGNTRRLPGFLEDAVSHYLIRVPERNRTYPKESMFGDAKAPARAPDRAPRS